MKKLKLQKPIKHNLTSEITPKKMAIRYITIGLERDSQIINKELICSRLGMSINKVSDSMINDCIKEIKAIVKNLKENMNLKNNDEESIITLWLKET